LRGKGIELGVGCDWGRGDLATGSGFLNAAALGGMYPAVPGNGRQGVIRPSGLLPFLEP
jgi:hypothetical protein